MKKSCVGKQSMQFSRAQENKSIFRALAVSIFFLPLASSAQDDNRHSTSVVPGVSTEQRVQHLEISAAVFAGAKLVKSIFTKRSEKKIWDSYVDQRLKLNQQLAASQQQMNSLRPKALSAPPRDIYLYRSQFTDAELKNNRLWRQKETLETSITDAISKKLGPIKKITFVGDLILVAYSIDQVYAILNSSSEVYALPKSATFDGAVAAIQASKKQNSARVKLSPEKSNYAPRANIIGNGPLSLVAGTAEEG